MTHSHLRLSDYDYDLPQEMIAQEPLKERDQSKLMVLNRESQTIKHQQFFELPDLLDENSVLVFNESRVIPARLKFKIGEGNAEILLIKPVAEDTWECIVRPGKKFPARAEAHSGGQPKTDVQIDPDCSFHVKNVTDNGLRTIQFHCDDFKGYLKAKGHMPTPPYIKDYSGDSERYQTIYSKTEGSVAAPTAGFHFTDRLLDELKNKGIQTEFVTLHVGLGTFQPVKTEDLTDHQMHSEWFELSEEVASRLNQAKKGGKKIIAVGTTSVRVLESCSDSDGQLTAQSGETDIFIYPGYQWKFINQLITNFHVPKSTLLMLVSSFADRNFILKAYEEAKNNDYRFFSFGDSMMIQ